MEQLETMLRRKINIENPPSPDELVRWATQYCNWRVDGEMVTRAMANVRRQFLPPLLVDVPPPPSRHQPPPQQQQHFDRGSMGMPPPPQQHHHDGMRGCRERTAPARGPPYPLFDHRPPPPFHNAPPPPLPTGGPPPPRPPRNGAGGDVDFLPPSMPFPPSAGPGPYGQRAAAGLSSASVSTMTGHGHPPPPHQPWYDGGGPPPQQEQRQGQGQHRGAAFDPYEPPPLDESDRGAKGRRERDTRLANGSGPGGGAAGAAGWKRARDEIGGSSGGPSPSPPRAGGPPVGKRKQQQGPPSQQKRQKKGGPLRQEQVELLVPMVRAAFCKHFPTLAHHHHHSATAASAGADPLPRSLFCPLPLVTEGLPPPTNPFAKGITPAARSLFAQSGIRGALSGAKTVAEYDENTGELSVRASVLRRLFVLLFAKDRSLKLPDMEAAQKQVVDKVYQMVSQLGAQLGNSKQGDYVRAALRTPWDVLGYCRSAMLNRVRALVVSLEGAAGGKKGMGKADLSLLPNLHQLVGQLAGASAYFWDAQSAEGLQQLAQRTAALLHQQHPQQLPPPPCATAPPTPTQQMLAGCGGRDEASPPLGQPLAEVTSGLDDSLIVSPPHEPPAPPPPAASSAAAVPRDPRKRPRERQPQQQHQPPPPLPPGQTKSLRFMLPAGDEPAHEYTTYFKSHTYEVAAATVTGLQDSACSHCKTHAWQMRCVRCLRCGQCGKLIFCKGAERRDNKETVTALGHVELMANRMDRAIWCAFKGLDDLQPIYALIAAGVNVNYTRLHKDETALMAAAYRNDADGVAELLRLGADPSLAAKDGMTAMAFALRHNDDRGKRCVALLQEALQRRRQQQQQQQQQGATSASG